MYRDLNDVEHYWKEAGAGRYEKQLLPSTWPGIPTYTVVGELALGAVLSVNYRDRVSGGARSAAGSTVAPATRR